MQGCSPAFCFLFTGSSPAPLFSFTKAVRHSLGLVAPTLLPEANLLL